MKKLKYIIATLSIVVLSSGAMAQTAISSYFFEGAFNNYKLNPAMDAERPFISMMMLGNFSMRTNGNVGISNFLYPNGDKLSTFMSGSVNQDEFLNNLPDYSRIGFNLDESLMSAGFRMLGGYSSIGVSIHSSMSISLPKGLFEFAKMGLQKEQYDFAGINVNTMNYMAITLGHSREIIKGLRVGANIKYLMGLAYADVTVDKLNVELTDKYWRASSHATAKAAFFCEAEAMLDDEDVIEGVELGSLAPSSSGFAFDLGAVYDLNHIVPGLTVSASIVDLGLIRWKHMMSGQSTDSSVEFDGFGTLDYDNMETTVEEEFEQLGDDAMELVDFNYTGTAAATTKLSPTMYLGAEYNMPFYNKLSVALLYGQRFTSLDFKKWYDVRAFVNVAPLNWFEATVNFGFSKYGSSLGWMLNFHPVGFNFFIGSDLMITKVTPQFIPVNNMNAHITMGVNIPFGRHKSKLKKEILQ